MRGPPLSFPRAAEKLGWGKSEKSGRRLRRMVIAREKNSGREIATRGSGKSRPIRGVTLAALFRHLPELRSAPIDELSSKFRAYLSGIDDNLRLIARSEAETVVEEQVAPQLEELRAEDAAIQQRMNDLAERIQQSTRPRKAS